jgi:hypothetical protein
VTASASYDNRGAPILKVGSLGLREDVQVDVDQTAMYVFVSFDRRNCDSGLPQATKWLLCPQTTPFYAIFHGLNQAVTSV